MSPLRQRMLDALVLRGMAVRTPEPYIDDVARLAMPDGARRDPLHVLAALPLSPRSMTPH